MSFLSDVEDAVRDYLLTTIANTAVYSGLASTTKEAPCVIVQSASAEEDPPKSGNYRVHLNVMVKAIGGDTDYKTLCASVRDALCLTADDLGAQINAASPSDDLHVWGGSAGEHIEVEIQDDCWVETQTLELYAAPNSFS